MQAAVGMAAAGMVPKLGEKIAEAVLGDRVSNHRPMKQAKQHHEEV